VYCLLKVILGLFCFILLSRLNFQFLGTYKNLFKQNKIFSNSLSNPAVYNGSLIHELKFEYRVKFTKIFKYKIFSFGASGAWAPNYWVDVIVTVK
jgi:hypothetical protein